MQSLKPQLIVQSRIMATALVPLEDGEDFENTNIDQEDNYAGPKCRGSCKSERKGLKERSEIRKILCTTQAPWSF